MAQVLAILPFYQLGLLTTGDCSVKKKTFEKNSSKLRLFMPLGLKKN